MRNKATHRNRSGYQPYHDVLAFLEEALPSTPVFAADGNASVFDNWLDPSASVSKVMDLTAEQFQFVRALYVALPPVSRTLPPGDHAVMLIFDSAWNQIIDYARKSALERRRGTTLRSFGVGSGVGDMTQGWRRGDAESGKGEAGGGTRG